DVRLIAMWSANRDQECPEGEVGYVSPSCSSIVQESGEFAQIFTGFNFGQSLPGDLNGDANLDVLDVVMMVNYILDYEFDESGDLTGDGLLDVLDIVALLEIILNSPGL
ncbi:MAG: hypothetical protein GXO91_00415, partial [FCB group bacterium]|nr:hypothetical protein [FCB group bacterium]